MTDLCKGAYAAIWGLTDLYQEAESKLRELLASGKDFTTNFGCKKEIRYCTYTRIGDTIHIRVDAHMDDLYEGDELIYDAAWEAFQREDVIADEDIENIRQAALEDGIDDFTVAYGCVSGDITYDAVMAETERLEGEAEKRNSDMFDRLVKIVKDYLGDSLWDSAREGFEADLDMGFDPYLGCYTYDV